MQNLIRAVEQLLDALDIPRSIADLGISRDDFERALPELAATAFDDPSWRSNPRMPLVTELIELFAGLSGPRPGGWNDCLTANRGDMTMAPNPVCPEMDGRADLLVRSALERVEPLETN